MKEKEMNYIIGILVEVAIFQDTIENLCIAPFYKFKYSYKKCKMKGKLRNPN